MTDRAKFIEDIKKTIGVVPAHMISDYNHINYDTDSIMVIQAKADAIMKEYNQMMNKR